MKELHRLVFDMYWLRWMCERDIADAMGYRDPSSVSRIMKANGWPTRSREDGRRLKNLQKRVDRAPRKTSSPAVSLWQRELNDFKDELWAAYGIRELMGTVVTGRGARAYGVQ